MRQQINKRKKQKILERDNFTCVNCGARGDFNSLEVDHIKSVISGGTNDYSNLQTLCYKCNMDKRHFKEVTDKYFLNLPPLDRLKLIKAKLEEYKNLSWAEFRIVFTQEELFKRCRLNLSDVEPLFRHISNQKKELLEQYNRFKEQRNILMYELYFNHNVSVESLSSILNMDIKSIYKPLAKIRDKKLTKDGIKN